MNKEKMLKIIEKTHRWMANFSPVIAAFGLLLIILPIVSVFGQNPHTLTEYQLHELKKRVDSLDQLSIAVNSIDRRITILETLQHENGNDSPWQRGTSVGTGMLIIEAAFRVGKKRYGLSLTTKKDDDEN